MGHIVQQGANYNKQIHSVVKLVNKHPPNRLLAVQSVWHSLVIIMDRTSAAHWYILSSFLVNFLLWFCAWGRDRGPYGALDHK